MPPKKYFTPEEKALAHSRIQDKYNAANTTRVFIRLNNKTDADILDYLSAIDNKQGFIKELIRADMQRKNNAT